MKRLFLLILLITIACRSFAQKTEGLTVEAASPDPTLVVRGPEIAIDFVNMAALAVTDNYVALLSSEFGSRVGVDKMNMVAVQVDAQMRVTKVVNRAVDKGQTPAFKESVDIAIPAGGFVLLASDDSYANRGQKKFLAENFKEGDVIKLRINNNVAGLADVVKKAGKNAVESLQLEGERIYTTLNGKEKLNGSIANFKKGTAYRVELTGKTNTMVKPDKNGHFTVDLNLSKGVNYIDVTLSAGGKTIGKESVIIFRKNENKTAAEVVLWVEQFPNGKVLTNDKAVADMVAKAKEAGFTSFGLDVKGPEGYVSYRKNDLSHTPHYTATINPNKKVVDDGFDLLQSLLDAAHKAGMKVYASFNFFTEGNVTTSDYAVLKQHPEWEEVVQRPEDKGKLLKISESVAGEEARQGKRIILGFVNPANKDVQDFQLLRVEEVLKNYDIDGIVMDRTRYDNLYADFSDVTKEAFTAYLAKEGKALNRFPDDAFRIDESGVLQQGPYFTEWITFRSGLIKDFAGRLRQLVDRYKASKNPELKLTAYVGSWYEVYYQNGVNWASENFRYDDRLKFPESRIYTDKYYTTSYLKYLDLLMIGTYYKTEKEVNKYITLGNILTNGEVPLLGSMSLPDLKTEEQAHVFGASVRNSAGLMIFDLCYVNWASFLEQMKSAGIAK